MMNKKQGDILFKTTKEEQKKVPFFVKSLKRNKIDPELVNWISKTAVVDQGIFELTEEWFVEKSQKIKKEIIRDLAELFRESMKDGYLNDENKE